MADVLPEPQYLRYQGPGDAYVLRYSLGPYQVTSEVEKRVPVPVPPDAARALLETGEWTTVDELQAIDEIMVARREAERVEQEWREQVARRQKQRIEEAGLSEIAAARFDAVRAVVRAVRERGGSTSERLVAAEAADAQFERDLRALAQPEVEPE